MMMFEKNQGEKSTSEVDAALWYLATLLRYTKKIATGSDGKVGHCDIAERYITQGPTD
jgi:hypothetical protein